MQTEAKYVQKVKAIRDEDGHWYVIPNELEDKFHKLLDSDYGSNSYSDYD